MECTQSTQTPTGAPTPRNTRSQLARQSRACRFLNHTRYATKAEGFGGRNRHSEDTWAGSMDYRMYIFEKCYMGFCTPKRTIMESKKKKKKKRSSEMMDALSKEYVELLVANSSLNSEEQSWGQSGPKNNPHFACFSCLAFLACCACFICCFWGRVAIVWLLVGSLGYGRKVSASSDSDNGLLCQTLVGIRCHATHCLISQKPHVC